MEAFEYAVKKDVRNNPIVREVDEARQRELWKWVGIAGLLVGVLLFSAWQHFELLRHGYQLEQLKKEQLAEEDLGRRLRLEIDTLRSPKRIEALGAEVKEGPGDTGNLILRTAFAALRFAYDGTPFKVIEAVLKAHSGKQPAKKQAKDTKGAK